MANVNQKIVALNVKIAKREDKLARIDKRIFDLKAEYKALKKDIDDLKNEVQRLELQQLSETLERNGITASDIAAAIADGSIKKTVSNAENLASGEVKNGVAEVTDDSEKEDTVNEVSGS